MDSGAHFYKCDFEVHTPRDPNWRGVRPVTNDERKEWADGLVAACRKKGLGSIAITDHHDFTLVPFVREAAMRETDENGELIRPEDRLVVFPGLELTLNVPCQALLILDADFPNHKLNSVLARLAVPVIDPAKEKLPPVIPVDVALLSQLYDEINKDPEIRNRYIVFPNVTDGGYQTLLRSHMHQKYREMPCVGGYVDGAVESKVGRGNQRIVDGLNPDYGRKRIALIQTSDSRDETYEGLGKYTTWIKWSVPTAEALRQACLAQESRISQIAPELPTSWISRIRVDNSMFLGPIELNLNSQYNAIIGGRGTGKSTILEYLRWVLSDVPAVVKEDYEMPNPSARQRKLISSTLEPTDSTVEVHFTVNEIPHVVRRRATSGELTLKVGNADFVKTRESDVRELLPIRAYSQKQLSSVSVRLDELTRFVTSPIRRDLSEMDQAIEELSTRIRENYATLQRKTRLQASVARWKLSEKSLFEQAANLRASLEDVTGEDRMVLNDKPKYDAVQVLADGWKNSIARALEDTERLQKSVGRLTDGIKEPRPDEVPQAMEKVILDFQKSAQRLLVELRETIGSAVDSLRNRVGAEAEYGQTYEQVKRTMEGYNETYTDVKNRSTAHTTKLAELSEVEKQYQAVIQNLRAHKADLQDIGTPEIEHAKLVDEMFRAMNSRSLRMAQECKSLAELSGGLIRATLQAGQGLDRVAEKFRGVISGSGLRSNRIEAFFQQLRAEVNPLATWKVAVRELELLSLTDDDSSITSEHYPSLSRMGLQVGDLNRVATHLNADGWLSLALTPVTDHPKFEYQTEGDHYIAFEDASAGQQATALLRVLLAQSGPPLIIDQPEDDLDNEVIVEVIQQIWNAKRRRQLIFASHNANLVVNGDAELVVHCDYRVRGEQSRGEIKTQGAIDLPSLRKAIVDVMDGGEKAFKLRADKYGF